MNSNASVYWKSNLSPISPCDNRRSSLRKQSKTSISSLSVNSNQFKLLTKFLFRKIPNWIFQSTPFTRNIRLHILPLPAAARSKWGGWSESNSSRRFHDISLLILLISFWCKHSQTQVSEAFPPRVITAKTFSRKIIPANLHRFVSSSSSQRSRALIWIMSSHFGAEAFRGKFKRKLFLEMSRLYLLHDFRATLELTWGASGWILII